MPIADDPRPRPSDEPEPLRPDPFDGLVLDERFVRGASVKEPAARTRMLTARWRLEPPVDPGGRRWSPDAPTPARGHSGRSARIRPRHLVLAVLAVTATLAALVLGPQCGLIAALGPWGRQSPAAPTAVPRPTTDAPLPGGGTTDGSKCGARGFHHFTPPSAPGSAPTPDPRPDAVAPGPQLVLGAYGFHRTAGSGPGEFTFTLLLGPGSTRPLDLSAPLGPQGVAVEIEGPDGLVGGAYGLPVTLDPPTAPAADGRIRIDPANGTAADVTMPAQALCPGFDGAAVQRQLTPPTDSSNTITGQPPYTLTVSIADPAVGTLRQALGSPVRGDVLTADNRVPR